MARKTKAEREAEEQRKRVVDEYGALDGELVRHKARRMDELGKIIRSWHLDADPEAGVSSTGDKYEVFLSAAGMQTRIVDIGEVYRKLGAEVFLEIASVTLKALEAHANPVELALLTKKERTGYRTFVVKSLAA